MYFPAQKALRLFAFSTAVSVSRVIRHLQPGPWIVSVTSSPAGQRIVDAESFTCISVAPEPACSLLSFVGHHYS